MGRLLPPIPRPSKRGWPGHSCPPPPPISDTALQAMKDDIALKNESIENRTYTIKELLSREENNIK